MLVSAATELEAEESEPEESEPSTNSQVISMRPRAWSAIWENALGVKSMSYSPAQPAQRSVMATTTEEEPSEGDVRKSYRCSGFRLDSQVARICLPQIGFELGLPVAPLN